jgi:flagellar hook-basal body complex protein FliE
MSISPINMQIGSAIGKIGAVEHKATSAVNQVGQTFDQVLNGLSATENNSDNLMARLAAGEDVDLHEVMIATEQTDVSFRVAMSIRDKLVDAYKEITRMSI